MTATQRRTDGRRVIGLTGGIGAGKSTAATTLAELGAVVVDCDQLGRDVATSTGAAFDSIVRRFGTEVVGPDGELDRAHLASIVFSDPDALADLNGITHPAIDAEIARIIDTTDVGRTVVLDMAVLVETRLGSGLYSEVLVIEAPLEHRLERLERDRGMARADAEARIANQASDAERRSVADHVIVNGGSPSDLRSAVETWWRSTSRTA